MKLIINGDIGQYYAQTLCMLYFPGAKFSPDEIVTDETPIVTLTMESSEDTNKLIATASIKIGEQMIEENVVDSIKSNSNIKIKKKIAIGKAFLAAGQKFFGYIPVWGMMTGIRPAKIARKMYSDGMDATAIRKSLRNEYFVNPKKAALLTEIAIREEQIVQSISQNSCSLYVSIPFCPTRCAYCSFVSYSTKRLLSLIPEYIERLLDDMDRVFDLIKRNGIELKTVYIGGGTPTTLSAEQLDLLLSKICEHTDVSKLEEFTLEAGRPDTITEEKLEVARAHGVTRISINPQALNNAVLEGIGRRHTAEDFYKAYELARNSGIPYINTDLIAGLPGDSYRSFSKTVDQILKLRPDNITVHSFAVKKSAEIAGRADIHSLGGGDVQKCVDYSQLKAKISGYNPYYIYRQKNTVGNLENVGFALDGAEGKYNIYMMEEVHHIFAVGAGSVTKLVDRESEKIDRFFMPKYPYEYLSMSKEEFKENYIEKIDSYLSSHRKES